MGICEAAAISFRSHIVRLVLVQSKIAGPSKSAIKPGTLLVTRAWAHGNTGSPLY
jgi:hypothetical protein